MLYELIIWIIVLQLVNKNKLHALVQSQTPEKMIKYLQLFSLGNKHTLNRCQIKIAHVCNNNLIIEN